MSEAEVARLRANIDRFLEGMKNATDSTDLTD